MPSKAKIGVLGASGYTGSECVRLLLRHRRAKQDSEESERAADCISRTHRCHPFFSRPPVMVNRRWYYSPRYARRISGMAASLALEPSQNGRPSAMT